MYLHFQVTISVHGSANMYFCKNRTVSAQCLAKLEFAELHQINTHSSRYIYTFGENAHVQYYKYSFMKTQLQQQ